MATQQYLDSIAESLRAWLASTNWQVLTGRRSSGPARGGALTPHLGISESAAGALSQIDLAIVRPDREEIVLAVEIADRPLPPDRVLGLAANLMLADVIRHNGLSYAIAESQLLVAVVAARRGPARSRLAALEDRLNWTAAALAKQGKPRLDAIRIATCADPAGLPDLVLAEARAIVRLPHR